MVRLIWPRLQHVYDTQLLSADHHTCQNGEALPNWRTKPCAKSGRRLERPLLRFNYTAPIHASPLSSLTEQHVVRRGYNLRFSLAAVAVAASASISRGDQWAVFSR